MATWKILKLFSPQSVYQFWQEIFLLQSCIMEKFDIIKRFWSYHLIPSFKNLYFNSNGLFCFVFCNLFFVNVLCCKLLLYFLVTVCVMYIVTLYLYNYICSYIHTLCMLQSVCTQCFAKNQLCWADFLFKYYNYNYNYNHNTVSLFDGIGTKSQIHCSDLHS